MDYPIREPSLEIEPCSDWSAILEKNKSLIFALAFGDRSLGQAISGAASRFEAMGSIPTRDFPPCLRCRIVSPSKVGISQRLNLAKSLFPFALEPVSTQTFSEVR